MTKSKIILASLGVVAGLGTAALPLASYAAQTPQSVSGNVNLAVEVQPAISMTIVGNNDDNSSYAAGATHADGVSVFNPAALNTNDDFDSYDATTAPAAVYNSASHQASSSYTSLLPNSVSNDATFKSAISVYTNSTTGYTVAVEDSDATTALTNQSDNTKTIPAGATLEAGTAAWAFKGGKTVTENEGVYTFTDNNNWRAMTANGTQTLIYGSNTKTTDGDHFDINYGVSTDADQATGVYTDTIIYTATTK
ncbi:hypothetical protein IJ765_00740 [Candidatus Saccharibacteria bacterium]|nr:hypothetical protein [Candidatus Saccharibacteria bacterium]